MSTSPYRPPQWTPPQPAAPGDAWLRRPWLGWVLAAVPILSVGLLVFLPFLRSGLIRPRQRWALIGLGLGLEAMVIAAFVMIGDAPHDAAGHVTGLRAHLATGLWLLTMAVGTVLAVLFRNPLRANLNRLPAGVLARRAGIPLHDAERVVGQRRVLGRFTSVEQAIAAADLPEESAMSLRECAVVRPLRGGHVTSRRP